ncbi:hypothetical protein [Acinetobacter indicus]|uniref:hypothetical protein n=1 Tax=Acinetobacter indicus TaxID=756892 RepID=UPI0014441D2C|nr:hypothetical protein [Acinetobacter indicus]
MSTNNFDLALYSKGKYWLYEHWNEANTNIYGKAKFDSKEDFLKHAGKHLTAEQIETLEQGQSASILQQDGTTLFFKYVNL